MSNAFPGDSPTPPGRPKRSPSKHAVAAPKGKGAYSTPVRNERILRLKEELNIQLELVVEARTRLDRELNATGAARMQVLTRDWVARLKDLTSCFNTLSASRIALDTADKKLEKDLTPAEERDAVIDFILSLGTDERRNIIHYLAERHGALTGKGIDVS